MTGRGGNDTLYAGAGRDSLEGGDGYDTALYAGKVTDYAVSFTSSGNVQVIDKVTSNGDDGTDFLSGVEQINFAGDGVTRIVTGSAAADHLTTDTYWSMMFGGDDNDTLTAAYGDDTLVGGLGDDSLIGELGHDDLMSGLGNDTLVGGAGNDTLLGGTGADKYVLNPGPQGIDYIKGFNHWEGDKIQIDSSSFGTTSTDQFSFNNSNGALSFSGQQFAILENVVSFAPSIDITLV